MRFHRTLTFVLLGALALAIAGMPTAAFADGKEVFLGQKCNLCHSVETADIEAKTKSEKLAGGDLSCVTDKHEAEWIAQFVRKEIQKDGEEHKKEFTGTDEELQAIIDWLKEQAAASKAGGEG